MRDLDREDVRTLIEDATAFIDRQIAVMHGIMLRSGPSTVIELQPGVQAPVWEVIATLKKLRAAGIMRGADA